MAGLLVVHLQDEVVPQKKPSLADEEGEDIQAGHTWADQAEQAGASDKGFLDKEVWAQH